MFRTGKRVARSEDFGERNWKRNGTERKAQKGLANERQALIFEHFYLPPEMKRVERGRKCRRFGGNKLNSFHKCLQKINTNFAMDE